MKLVLHVVSARTLLAALRPLMPMEQAIVDELSANVGGYVPLDDLISAVYRDADSEPEDARGCIRITIYRLRQRGFRIVGRFGGWYGLVSPGIEVVRGVVRDSKRGMHVPAPHRDVLARTVPHLRKGRPPGIVNPD